MTEVTRNIAIRYITAASPLGRMLVARTQRGVRAVAFAENDAALLADLQQNLRDADLNHDPNLLAHEVPAILALLSNAGATPAELQLDLHGTPFQQRAWQAMRSIPRGQTVTYQQLATRLQCHGGQVAVGAACAANRVAVLVPCHRVLGAGNKLHGYRWGPERKRRLLEIEGALPAFPAQSGLFAPTTVQGN